MKAATTRAERAVGLAWAPKPDAAECIATIEALADRLSGPDAAAVLRAACLELHERRQLHERRVACARRRAAATLASAEWRGAIRAAYAARVRMHNYRIGTQPEGAGAHHGATAGEGR